MSDFLYSQKHLNNEFITEPLKKILPNNEPIEIMYFKGKWGSLAVSLGKYNGFAPFENEQFICVVIGGPALYFPSNAFNSDSVKDSKATESIFYRWLNGELDLSKDLSGPFVLLIINKVTNQVICHTDLMLFIPVYQCTDKNNNFIGTHIDALAEISNQLNSIDKASVVDFILNGTVTFPYTIYKNIYQLHPASKYEWQSIGFDKQELRQPYWQPTQNNTYKNIDEAANSLREGLNNYITLTTKTMTKVAMFISAGEDSRAIAGLLPKNLEKNAYIFVDSKNREFKLAKKIATAYDCHFHYLIRDPLHYLNILPSASLLVGSGQQYLNAHSLGLAKESGAAGYHAVFGGFGADNLLKGLYVKKYAINRYFSFLPVIFYKKNHTPPFISSKVFNNSLIKEVNGRRLRHFKLVQDIRNNNDYEWFNLWPYTMRPAACNISVNRRLFPSYEVFTCLESVKISASIPVEWKLNRRLYQKALKPAFKRSRRIPHADGRLPYYSWLPNMFIQTPRWLLTSYRRVTSSSRNDGPWADWNYITNSSYWNRKFKNEKLSELSPIQLAHYAQVKFLIGDTDVF